MILSKGILETIDMDSYRVEIQAAMKIALPDADAEIGPVPTRRWRAQARTGTGLPVNIIKAFNDQFGNIHGRTQTRFGRSSRRKFRRRWQPTRPIRTR